MKYFTNCKTLDELKKRYPGITAEMDLEKIMGEIKRAARRNPSGF